LVERDAAIDGGEDAGFCRERIPAVDAGGFELAVCSSSPLERFVSCTDTVHGCELHWGCDSYGAALVTVETQCDDFDGRVWTGRGWGFRFISTIIGGYYWVGYYDDASGALVGIESADDQADGICTGTVPANRYDDESVTDRMELCLGNPDAGSTDGG
jgi:hypothetical protein